MLVAVKVSVVDQISDTVPGAVVQQQPTQHTGLGLDRMRGHAQLGDLLIGPETDLVQTGIEGRKRG